MVFRTHAAVSGLLLLCASSAAAMTINVTYGSGVPTQAKTAFNAVVTTYDSYFSNNISINIDFDWGSSGLGSSQTEIGYIDYTDWRAFMQLDSAENIGNSYP